MQIVSRKIGYGVHPLLGIEMPLVGFFMRLQENILPSERMAIKHFLRIANYNPNSYRTANLHIHADTVTVFPQTGNQFDAKLTGLHLKHPLVLKHPMGHCQHNIDSEELTLLIKAKKRYNLVYK